ncbi:MAG: hypothetical protein J7K68_00040 [Candidatus Diapherotrites archaeon]|nr:hypothetical protein [Candidatus Diapherotrites archaeon]
MAKRFCKYARGPLVDADLDPKAHSYLKRARQMSERKREIPSHHILRDAFEKGYISEEAFQSKIEEFFTKRFKAQALPYIIDAANLAYEGEFVAARSKINEAKEKGLIEEHERIDLLEQIKSPETCSMSMVMTPERAEATIRRRVENLKHETLGLSPEELEELKDILHEEYMKGEGELHEFVQRLVSGNLQGEERLAYHFARKVREYGGPLHNAIKRLLRQQA